MTPAVLDRPASLFAELGPAGASSAGRPGDERVGAERLDRGRLTLEELLNGTLRTVLADGEADCPMCHARMTRRHDGGECGGCGTGLS